MDLVKRALLHGLLASLLVVLAVRVGPWLRSKWLTLLLLLELRRLSQPAFLAVKRANSEAERLTHRSLGTEHLLLGILDTPGCVGLLLLRRLGVATADMKGQIENMVWNVSTTPGNRRFFTVQCISCIRMAVQEARRLNHPHAGTGHLLVGIVREGSGVAAAMLANHGVTLEGLLAALADSPVHEPPQS
ncbi:MAG: Clp protease N-terminal domain-containing protein [Candidatus Xenobia bacterium]